jgi:hypothetical protein
MYHKLEDVLDPGYYRLVARSTEVSMHGRGFYGYGYAHPYYAQYAMLGQDPSAPPPAPPPGGAMMAPPDHTVPPMQQIEHKIKLKPAPVHLSTGGFFQVAAAVTLGLIGAGVIAGVVGAAAVKYQMRGVRAGNGGNGRLGNGSMREASVEESHGARMRQSYRSY